MSNLTNNTTQLELLLQKVNELPEAGGGGSNNAGEWIQVLSLPTTYVVAPGGRSYYYEIPENCYAVLIANRYTGTSGVSYKGGSGYFSSEQVGSQAKAQDADGTGTILEIVTDSTDSPYPASSPSSIYLLPIYGTRDLS